MGDSLLQVDTGHGHQWMTSSRVTACHGAYQMFLGEIRFCKTAIEPLSPLQQTLDRPCTRVEYTHVRPRRAYNQATEKVANSDNAVIL